MSIKFRSQFDPKLCYFAAKLVFRSAAVRFLAITRLVRRFFDEG